MVDSLMLNYEAILVKEFTVAKPGDCNVSLDIIACFRTRQLNQYIYRDNYNWK